MSRRGATSLAGILLVDKPSGMTSHDVVAAVRRATGEGRVGHAGTLDPMATGLLVVLVGPYTRLEPYLSSLDKTYEAAIAFGSETDTDDAEGATTRTAEVPARLTDEAFAREVLSAIVGESMQRPPAYSAIKSGGRVAHRAARAGEPLDLPARPIRVAEASLVLLDTAARTWTVRFVVSKGTYVRALARDIGRACGSAAHLSALRRTSTSAIGLESAHTLDEVAAAAADGRVSGLFADPVGTLGFLTAPGDAELVRRGSRMPAPAIDAPDGALFAIVRGQDLSAVYRLTGGELVPEVVFPCEEVR